MRGLRPGSPCRYPLRQKAVAEKRGLTYSATAGHARPTGPDPRCGVLARLRNKSYETGRNLRREPKGNAMREAPKFRTDSANRGDHARARAARLPALGASRWQVLEMTSRLHSVRTSDVSSSLSISRQAALSLLRRMEAVGLLESDQRTPRVLCFHVTNSALRMLETAQRRKSS